MKKLVVCNWKLNGSLSHINKFSEAFREYSQNLSNLIICVPYVYLANIKNNLQCTIGAQDLSFYTEGAYTGEVSGLMLADIGCEYVIVGHSERRKYFHETDKIVKDKAEIALIANLKPIICVGETQEERENGTYKDVILRQILSVNFLNIADILIAYEPCWAIGTGLIPTLDQITEIHEFIKQTLNDVRVLYGGSVNTTNAKEILDLNCVDGVLIGSASLHANNIIEILNHTS